jgi:hypothetical protein
MTTDTDTHDDASLRDHLTSRRHVLKLIGLVAATGRASAQSDGDVAVGGGGAGHDFRHGVWSFAPPNFPPEGRASWIRRDGSAGGLRYDASLPLTFEAAGAQWSIASDFATAKSNVTSYPAIAVGSDKSAAIVDSALPVTWVGDGVEHVVAADLSGARSARSQTPAVLFPNDGSKPRAVVA